MIPLQTRVREPGERGRPDLRPARHRSQQPAVSGAYAGADESVPRMWDYIGSPTPRRIAVIVLTVLVYLVVGEFAVRWFNVQTEFIQREMFTADDRLMFRMLANYHGVMSKRAVPVSTDSWGLRDREYGAPAPGTLRVYALGDSLIFGYGVPMEQTYTRVLERLLEQRLGRPVEVVNGGIPGYGTLQELAFFEETVERVQPNVVVLVVSVLNDASDDVKYAARTNHARGVVRSGLYRTVAWLREKSQLFLLLKRRFAGNDAAEDLQVHAVHPPPKVKRGLQLIEESLEGFAQAAQRHGATFGVILAPAHRQVSPALWAETLRRHNLRAADYARNQPDVRLVAYAQRAGIPILDVQPMLEQHQQEQVYWSGDGEHWEVRGHELMAEATADFLARSGLLGAPVAASNASQ